MPLNHVALTVSDREASARFYGEHFGLVDRLHDDEHLLILTGPDGSVLAMSTGTPPELPRTNHFGFQLASAYEVLEARERFRAAGITETEFSDETPVRVQVADPDGYRVEFFAY